MFDEIPDQALFVTADCLMRGMHPGAAIVLLMQSGLDESQAAEVLRRAFAHPFIRAGRRIEEQKLKLESYLDMLSKITRRRDGNTVDRLESIDASTFFDRYFFGHRPVLLAGMAKGCPALGKWTPAYFAERFGDSTVEFMANRMSDADHERKPDVHRTTTSIRDYMASLVEARETNDFYIVAHNHTLKNEALSPLVDDLTFTGGILDDSRAALESAALWIGPRGTLTELHHDTRNVMFVQILGRKRFQLLPSCELHRVGNEIGVFAKLDLANPPPRSPIPYEVELSPGDMLFLPVGWWHRVRALDVSISVSLTRFLVDGETIEWLGQYWLPE